jgi:hypothetical protein
MPSQGLLAAPSLQVDSIQFDAGQKPAGTTVKHDFIITNNGDEPLVIQQVIPSCGCTLASFDDFIAPGRTGKISVNVELYREWAGQEYIKSVTVVSNDPNSPIRLSIRGTVGQVAKQNTSSAPIPKPKTYLSTTSAQAVVENNPIF